MNAVFTATHRATVAKQILVTVNEMIDEDFFDCWGRGNKTLPKLRGIEALIRRTAEVISDDADKFMIRRGAERIKMKQGASAPRAELLAALDAFKAATTAADESISLGAIWSAVIKMTSTATNECLLNEAKEMAAAA